jgi:hypothetical protein
MKFITLVCLGIMIFVLYQGISHYEIYGPVCVIAGYIVGNRFLVRQV